MEITGSYTVYAARDRVWAALLDPDLLQRTIPGCEELERIGEDTYRMRLHVGVAAVKGTYDGKLRLADLKPPESYRLTAEGSGARGVLRGDGMLILEARDAATTVVSYTGQAQLGGPIAGVGMRVAGGAANMIIKSYFSKLADILAQDAPAALTSDTPESLRKTLEAVAQTPLQDTRAPSPGSTTTAPARAASVSPAGVAVAQASLPRPANAPTTPTRPQTTQQPSRGPVTQLVRRVGLTDGSIESERYWSRMLLGGVLAVAALALITSGALLVNRFQR